MENIIRAIMRKLNLKLKRIRNAIVSNQSEIEDLQRDLLSQHRAIKQLAELIKEQHGIRVKVPKPKSAMQLRLKIVERKERAIEKAYDEELL